MSRVTCCATATASLARTSETGARHGHRRSAVDPSLALAASVCGTGHWLDSARVPGPSDRVQRSLATPCSSFVFRLLSQIPNPSLVGQGLARAAADSIVGNGASRGSTPGRWTSPPLRTTSRLSHVPPPYY